MALPVDLGRGVFHNLDANLAVTLSASAEIIPDPETTGPKYPESLRQLLQNRQIWVTQAPEAKLHLSLGVGPNLAHPASAFFSQAGDLLRSSKLWSDLGLGVLFRSYNYDHEASGSRCIHLYFGLRKLASRSANAKIFRLPVTLQNPPEAVPPAGISTASLLSVTIAIEYTPANETIEYMPTHLYTTPMVEWDNSKKNHFLITPPSSQNQYLPPKSSQETCLDEDAGPYIKEDASEADEAWVPFHCFHASKHSSLCKEDFDKLLDISIRSLITPKPTCVDEIIQQEKDEYSTHLCSLAPTVFSMGYSGAMNQCSQFIPSIAKSLESIIGRSRNPVLQEKISALKSPQSQTGGLPKEVTLRTAIKVSLWRTAQKQLYNPNASRGLSPLNSIITKREEPPIDDISDIEDAEDDRANEDDYLVTDEEEELIFSDDEAEIFPRSDDVIDFSSPPQNQNPFDHQDNLLPPISCDGPSPKDELVSSPCLLATFSPDPDKSLFQNVGSDSEMLTDPLDHDILIQEACYTTFNQEDYVSDDICDMIWD